MTQGPVLLSLTRDGSLSFFSVSLELQGYLTLRCSLKLAPRLHSIRASFCPLLSLEKGEYIVIGSEDASVYFYDLTRPKNTRVNKLQERISNIAHNILNGECTPVHDQNAHVHITIGDGGNIEGLATFMTEPQPKYSAFREASFGHATMEIKNRTHAYYYWHRNVDGYAVKSDSMVFFNRYWFPKHESTIQS